MANRDLDALPERSVALVRAFGASLNRSVIIGGVVAFVLAIVMTASGIVDRYVLMIAPFLIAVIAAIAGVVAAIATIPPRLRRAFEAFSWLGHAEVQTFKARTGAAVPTKVQGMKAWLASTPSTPTMRLPRVELLGFIGRHGEARAELDAATEIDPASTFEIATLRHYLDWLEHGSTDLSRLREAADRLPAGSEARRSSAVTLALAEARIRFIHGEPGWASSLEAVRSSLGPAPWRATLIDTWLPVGFLYFVAALVAAFTGQVLRVML
jgi:hypothetical protein